MENFFTWFGLPGTVVLAVLLFLLAAGLALVLRTKDRALAAAGMAACALGGIVMTDSLGVQQLLPVPGFYVGAALLLIGHGLYTAAYVTLIRKHRYRVVTTGLGAGVILTAAVFTGLTVAMATGGTFPGGAAYGFCLLYTAAAGATLSVVWSFSASERTARSAAALGALALFLSDGIIVAGALCGADRLDGLIGWLYPIGQLLLLLCA